MVGEGAEGDMVGEGAEGDMEGEGAEGDMVGEGAEVDTDGKIYILLLMNGKRNSERNKVTQSQGFSIREDNQGEQER